jgi:uncharacterized protein YraI
MPTIKTLSAAFAALVVSGGIAAAASTTNDLNMRSGPGPEYQVIGVIPSGAPVDVLGCSGSWCQVNFGGRAGYASASYLSGDARASVMTPGARGYGPSYGPTYAPAAPAYGPTYGYVDRGYAAPGSYAYDDDDDDDDDDDGYAAAPTATFGGWNGGYQDWRGGYRDW